MEFQILRDKNRVKSKANEFYVVKLILKYKPHISKNGISKEEYKKQIEVQRESSNLLEIVAWTSENQWAESIENTFEYVTKDPPEVINNLISSFGFNLRSKNMYRKKWKDAKPPVFNLKLVFKTETNALEDVYKPVRLLQRCFVCSELWDGGDPYVKPGDNLYDVISKNTLKILDIGPESVLSPPGPPLVRGGIFNALENQFNKVTLEQINVGKFITLNNFVATNIRVSWDMQNIQKIQISNNNYVGVPMMATVDIDLECLMLWTDRTLQNLTYTFTDGIAEKNWIDISQIVKEMKQGWENTFPKSDQVKYKDIKK